MHSIFNVSLTLEFALPLLLMPLKVILRDYCSENLSDLRHYCTLIFIAITIPACKHGEDVRNDMTPVNRNEWEDRWGILWSMAGKWSSGQSKKNADDKSTIKSEFTALVNIHCRNVRLIKSIKNLTCSFVFLMILDAIDSVITHVRDNFVCLFLVRLQICCQFVTMWWLVQLYWASFNKARFSIISGHQLVTYDWICVCKSFWLPLTFQPISLRLLYAYFSLFKIR